MNDKSTEKTGVDTATRKRLEGVVIGDRQSKTRIVSVTRRVVHPVYSKVINIRKKFYAHDEKEISSEGDIVTIEECRPMSRLKRWRVVEVRK